MLEEKVCKTCEASKPLADFPKNARNKDGKDIRCKPCAAERTRLWRSANPEAARASEKLWRNRNADRVRRREAVWRAAWRADRPGYSAGMARKYRAENPERVKAAARRYAKEHPELYAAAAAKRRATILRASPAWLTAGQIKEIAAMYAEARRLTNQTGVDHHVDHIIPLCGRGVSGLHVPWNLQVITADENRRKWITAPDAT